MQSLFVHATCAAIACHVVITVIVVKHWQSCFVKFSESVEPSSNHSSILARGKCVQKSQRM